MWSDEGNAAVGHHVSKTIESTMAVIMRAIGSFTHSRLSQGLRRRGKHTRAEAEGTGNAGGGHVGYG